MTDCPKGEQDLASLYLAGKLPEGEAEAFEKHYFECESCWQDVQRGSELRAALGKPAVAPMALPARSARTWMPLAAAAVIAFVGIGVWQLTRRAAQDAGRPVMRSTVADVLELKVAVGPRDGYELSWPSHPDAAVYRVQIVASDGVSLWKKETTEPRLSIGPGVVPAPDAGKVVQVEALDPMGRLIARSQLVPLPKR